MLSARTKTSTAMHSRQLCLRINEADDIALAPRRMEVNIIQLSSHLLIQQGCFVSFASTCSRHTQLTGAFGNLRGKQVPSNEAGAYVTRVMHITHGLIRPSLTVRHRQNARIQDARYTTSAVLKNFSFM